MGIFLMEIDTLYTFLIGVSANYRLQLPGLSIPFEKLSCQYLQIRCDAVLLVDPRGTLVSR